MHQCSSQAGPRNCPIKKIGWDPWKFAMKHYNFKLECKLWFDSVYCSMR